VISAENERRELENTIGSYVFQSGQPTHDLEAIRQARQIMSMCGVWLEQNLSKDAANIYLLIGALKSS